MLILQALRTRARVLTTQARIMLGSLMLPATDRAYFKAKGLALIALHWRGLAQACGDAGDVQPPVAAAAPGAARSAVRWHGRAGASADRALLALADAGIVSGDLFSALLSFAAHPERWRSLPAAGAAPADSPAQGR